MAVSDAPAALADEDRLEFVPLARGISRFLRNENTVPPLTLAITGDWGSGKSSLMGLVSSDLDRFGWRPVSFNAWHHQNEEQMLAALLTAIRDTALPSMLTLEGIAFRIRLLWERVRRNYRLAIVLVAAAALAIGYLVSPNAAMPGWGQLALFLQGLTTDAKSAKPVDPLIFPTLLAQVAIVVSVALALARALKAFGVDPAVLLSSTVARFKLKDASAQTSFRMRFARQFAEVTRTLRHPMVIVIDDLDRCKPSAVQEVMEAVNFLTTSGRCFIIFGMATRRVLAALALSFEDIAKELIEFDSPAGQAPDPGSAAERERRHNYARDYLEKLVNIEIVVPDRSDLPPAKLLERAPRPGDSLGARVVRTLRSYALLIALLLVSALGFGLGQYLAQTQATPGAAATSASTQAVGAMPIPSSATSPAAARASTDQGQTGGTARGRLSSRTLTGAVVALLLLAGLAAFAARLGRIRGSVEDSRAFGEALDIWIPIATFERSSPRSIKRFGNRIRYLAMLQQGQRADDEPLPARLRKAFWAGREAAQGSEQSPDRPRALALSEHRVVALGALHAYLGDSWRLYAEGLAPVLSGQDRRFHEKYQAAVVKYQVATRASWPPSAAELDAFARSLKGIRLPGDPSEIAPGLSEAVEPPASPPPESPEAPSDVAPPRSGPNGGGDAQDSSGRRETLRSKSVSPRPNRARARRGKA